jgi:hypothetical protein
MPTKAQHCPFLNRADPRCSEAFNIDKLDHAFKYCFGRYTACPLYLELLIERRVKRTATQGPARAGDDDADGQQPIIQVTIRGEASPGNARQNSKPGPDARGISAVPRRRERSGG